MKIRHVYSTPNLTTAKAALAAARGEGISDADLLLVARSDIELECIPDDRLPAGDLDIRVDGHQPSSSGPGQI